MYSLSSQITGLPVISLQTGEIVALTRQPIVNPDDLEVVAFHCETTRQKSGKVMMARDVRQTAKDCLIIDNEDELSDAEDIVRLSELIARNYSPLEKIVFTQAGRRLGKVEDFTLNLNSHRIQKLYVRQSLLQSFKGSSLIIDRSEIVDVSGKRIVVRDATVKNPLPRQGVVPNL